MITYSGFQWSCGFANIVIITVLAFNVLHHSTLFQFVCFVFHMGDLGPDGIVWSVVHVHLVFFKYPVQGFRCAPNIRDPYVRFFAFVVAIFVRASIFCFVWNMDHPLRISIGS